jgi:uncharacterized protein (DUF1499 family)
MKQRLAAIFGVVLALSGCSGTGAEYQAVPAAGALETLERPTTSNTSLAAPASFSPKPDIVTQAYAVSGPTLYAAMTQVAEDMPRTYKLVAYEGRYESAYVVRSRVFNFPDTIQFKVLPVDAGHSALVVYSASRYGEGDFGVNRARVEAWLTALNRILNPTPGSGPNS